MENQIKVYEGPFHMIGVPIVIVTGYSTVTSHLFSEYFTFFRCDRTFFEMKRFHHFYDNPAPDAVKLDVSTFMRIALDKAKLDIKRFFEKKFLESKNERFVQPFELREVPEELLLILHLSDENPNELQKIKDNTQSPKLQVYLSDILKIPKLTSE